MRRRLSLATIGLLGSLLLAATPAEAQLTLSVSGGATFAEISGDVIDDDLVGTRTGFNVGAMVDFPLNDLFSVGTGLYYVQKGAELEEAAFQEEGALELDYLEIPLLLRVQVTRAERPVGFSFFAGPQISFEVGCDFTFEDRDEERSCEEDDNDAQSTDFGGIFGASASYDVSETTSLFLAGGVDVSFTDTFDAEGDAKNTAYFIDAGVSFPIGG